ncbi:hypothetical protein CRI77_15235 [Mycolicibacterium duvalii]|nr:hypothetical protein CRI77_15235 [Mycolicibacterium duvalii]
MGVVALGVRPGGEAHRVALITVDAVQAFELLKRLSQESNTTLVDVARLLIETDHPREEDD